MDTERPLPFRPGLLALVAHTWIRTAVGGAACGLLVVGTLSIELARATVPAGLVVGAVLGVPLGLLLAIVIRRPRTPAQVRALGAALQAVGMVVALALTLPFQLLVIRGSLSPHGTSTLGSAVLNATQTGVLGIAACAVIGRALGYSLARTVSTGYGLERPRCGLLLW